MSRPLIYLPLRSIYLEEDATRDPVVDGNMEAPTAAAYTAAAVTLSKIAGSRPGGSGTQVLHAVSTGGATDAYQNGLTIGGTYRIVVWQKTDGTFAPRIYGGGAVRWTGLVNNAWQQGDTGLFVATDAEIGLYQGVLGAGQSWDADDLQAIPSLCLTRNIGSVSTNVQCGDGLTPATFPTMLTPSISLRRGVALNGAAGVNLRCLTDLPALTDITAVVQFVGLQKTVNYPGLMGKVCTGTAGWSLSAELDGGGRRIPTFYVGGTGFGRYISAAGIDLADGGLHTVMGTYVGATGIASLYVDGLLVRSAAATGALDGGGTTTYVGGDGVFLGRTTAKMLHASVWPLPMTPQQVSVFHNRLLSELST